MSIKKSIITVDQSAAKRIANILTSNDGKGAQGLRISIKASGCSGLGYKFDLVSEINASDEVINVDGFNLFIDKGAILYIIGSELKYVSDTMKSGFIFQNPNAKETCGCGVSFAV